MSTPSSLSSINEVDNALKRKQPSGSQSALRCKADEKYVLRDESNYDRILSSTHSTDQASDGNGNSSNNSSSSNNNFIRTCSDPKSLCNACGIRQRKARRAMATAQAEASDTFVASETSSTNGNKLRIKAKRCKLTIRRSQKKLCFEDVALSLSKSSAYHQ
ncbi:hypothetical protein FRX31_012022, partial [Thalictrum thalictroides]